MNEAAKDQVSQVHTPQLSYVVVAESWEGCVAARTMECLSRLEIRATLVRAQYTEQPCSFGDIVDRALRTHLDSEFVVVISAGTFVEQGFREAVTSFCSNHEFALCGHILNQKGFPWPYLHRQFLVVSTRAYSETGMPEYSKDFGYVPQFIVSESSVHDDYTPLWIRQVDGEERLVKMIPSQNLLAAFLRAGQTVVNVPQEIRGRKSYLYHINGFEPYFDNRYTTFSLPAHHTIPKRHTAAGRTTFHQLQKCLKPPTKHERPIREFNGHFAQLSDRTYIANTEWIEVECEPDWNIDTLVCVASGIKPWYLANCFRGSLKTLILVDSNEEQLRFAAHVRGTIAEADTWSDVVAPFSGHSFPTHEFHSRCDAVYPAIRNGEGEWSFETKFLQGNWLTQTFGIIEYIESISPRNVFVWWSNVFCPYNKWFIDDFVELELGLVDVLSARFPSLVVMNDQVHPIKCGNGERERSNG